MKKGLMALLVMGSLVLGACSVAVQKVTEFATNDLVRTSELAAKYNKPEVKQCADFLITKANELKATEAGLDGLLNESTSGLFSSALKAVLIKEYFAKLSDPVNAEMFKKAFESNCREVAGQIMFDILRDSINIGRKSRGF